MRLAHNNKRDASEKAIVEALEAAGCQVWRLDRPVDLLVCYRGQRLFLIECKTNAAKLNKFQADFIQTWPVTVLRNANEAFQFIQSLARAV